MVKVVQLLQMVPVVQVVQVVCVVPLVQVVNEAKMVSLDDVHSENVWFTWFKPPKY